MTQLNKPSAKEALSVWLRDWRKIVPTRKKIKNYQERLKDLDPNAWGFLFLYPGMVIFIVYLIVVASCVKDARTSILLDGIGIMIYLSLLLVAMLVRSIVYKYREYRRELEKESKHDV
jgi:hypothetical protein